MAAEREIQGFITEGARFFGGIYDAVMAGGEIQASIRQGFRELGNAFGQMWPDQITVVEPGAVFNPLHFDLAAEKASHTPSAGMDAEAGHSPAPPSDQAVSKASSREGGKLPSPSEIANHSTPQPARSAAAQPDRGPSQQQGREA